MSQHWKGVGVPGGDVHHLECLPNIGGWFDWGTTDLDQDEPHPDFLPLIRPHRSLDKIRMRAEKHPGWTWLFGNEPELESQDNISPREAAELYQSCWDIIKGASPASKIVGCGTTMHTDWLEQFRRTGVLKNRPLDAIHFHSYPGGYSRDEIRAWRYALVQFYRYLQRTPEYGGKPVWITEIGILKRLGGEVTQEKVLKRFMAPFLSYYQRKLYRYIERIFWFSTIFEQYNASDLVVARIDGSFVPTILGQYWNDFRLEIK